MRSGRNGPNRAELPLFSETGRKPKRPKFNGCLMIQDYDDDGDDDDDDDDDTHCYFMSTLQEIRNAAQ